MTVQQIENGRMIDFDAVKENDTGKGKHFEYKKSDIPVYNVYRGYTKDEEKSKAGAAWDALTAEQQKEKLAIIALRLGLL